MFSKNIYPFKKKKKLDKFVWKTWISRRLSSFVDILSGIREIFLQGCLQNFFFIKYKV